MLPTTVSCGDHCGGGLGEEAARPVRGGGRSRLGAAAGRSPACAARTLALGGRGGSPGLPGCSPAGPSRMEPAAFATELRQRLAVPDSAADGWCPRCDDVMDRCSRRAAVCSVGGERTLRHHALRNTLFTCIDRAGLQPERERLGLLLPQHPEDTRVAARRPADIFVPSYMGSPTAFDPRPFLLGLVWSRRLSQKGADQARLRECAQHHISAAPCRGFRIRDPKTRTCCACHENHENDPRATEPNPLLQFLRF